MKRRNGTPKECKDLVCSHLPCAHGRPHCPVCPAPGATRRTRAATCAACSGGTALPGRNICRACSDRGIDADRLRIPEATDGRAR